ncbi:M15 family metallopeptidase [Streptomyces winkii]|uniref:M15 family metallopeptidase n=1 Tax=Streptomyces winkii TaxID=3051178 RepID=UPI0037DA4F32
MTRSPPSARTTTCRIRRLLFVGPMVVTAAVTGVLGCQVPKSPPSPVASSSPTASPPRDTPHGEHERADRKGALAEADGALPDGATVFSDAYAGVADLDPDLLQALREAATDAADDGLELYVNSGWRSREDQDQLLREAVSEYGSEEEAARWVATADTSPHVSGDAVDIGHSDATAWLSEHGARYGLCQIYRNEPWHYELRTKATGVPRLLAWVRVYGRWPATRRSVLFRAVTRSGHNRRQLRPAGTSLPRVLRVQHSRASGDGPRARGCLSPG